VTLAHYFGTGDGNVWTTSLAVLIGAILLVVALATLLTWLARGRGNRIGPVVPVDSKVEELWAQQLELRRPFQMPAERRAA
jgi:hypothetical protein